MITGSALKYNYNTFVSLGASAVLSALNDVFRGKSGRNFATCHNSLYLINLVVKNHLYLKQQNCLLCLYRRNLQQMEKVQYSNIHDSCSYVAFYLLSFTASIEYL